MRRLFGLAGLLALGVATPVGATTYLMDWSASGTGQRVNGGPHGYTENITVTESGHGSFTVDDSKLGGSFHDYLTAFSLVSHIVETDHETAPGFDFTRTDEGDVTFGLGDPGFFSFTPATAGQPALLSFSTGDKTGTGGVGEYITDTNNVFTSTVRPQGITTTGKLTFTQAAAVPEPASWALMLMGFGAVGAALRRRPTFATA